MEPNCIILMYDDRYEIMGPFKTHDDLVANGQRWQAENGDRPTWQSIFLADPGGTPHLIAPS